MVRPVSRRWLVASAALALAVCLCPGVAEAQATSTIDHFWCYRIQDAPRDVTVLLQDQFDPAGALVPALVRNPVRFCNPVEKTTTAADGTTVVTPITNDDAHLKLYLAHTPVLAPARTVRVTNQFGGQALKVYDPIALGVPTSKNTQPDAKGLDHFKCYRADGPALRNKVVKLRDQFNEGEVIVRRPMAFCNPTVKVHAGTATPILNTKAHLVCYTVTPTVLDAPIPFTTRNQFGGEELLTQASDLLCVPSQKGRVGVIQ
jgi:hypothetical protein